MRARTKIIFFDDNNEKFFGEGPYLLLKGLEETGSLRAAALQMEMAYTKALKLIAHAENALGFSLTTRKIGGSKGGGSQLTEQGKEWIKTYEAYRAACEQANYELFLQYYPAKNR